MRAALLAALLIPLAGCAGSASSTLSYTIVLDVDAPATDARLVLPAPQRWPGALLASLREAIPANWSLEEREDGAIELSAPSLPVGPLIIAIEEDRDAVDTQTPQAEEPLLAPRRDAAAVDCGFPHPEDWDPRLKCERYATTAELPEGTSAIVTLEGRNERWMLGWSGNSYTDIVIVERGEARGALTVGMGRYG